MEHVRVFFAPGSITANGGRPPHCLHPAALLWSNPTGLVRIRAWGGWTQSIGSRKCGRPRLQRQGCKGAAMLATLNSKQIVDEIVKDTIKDNDPHDALQISPDVIMASRPGNDAPTLAPEVAKTPEAASRPSPRSLPRSTWPPQHWRQRRPSIRPFARPPAICRTGVSDRPSANGSVARSSRCCLPRAAPRPPSPGKSTGIPQYR